MFQNFILNDRKENSIFSKIAFNLKIKYLKN